MRPVAELDKMCTELVAITASNETDLVKDIKSLDYLETHRISYTELQYIMLRIQVLKEEELMKLTETEGAFLVSKAKRILNPSSSSVKMI